MESTSCIKFSLMSLIWIIVLMNEIHGYKACLETERTALLEIKSFFISVSDIGYDDNILPSWVGEDDGMPSDCCDDWEGVKCNATTRCVMQLSLNNTKRSNYFESTSASLLINMSLFHPFEELQSLDLSDNWFTGFSYDSNGSLKQLKILDLGGNFFNDSILPYLNTLTSLTTLILSDNSIEGSRTKQGLANLRYLQVLDLSWNFNITSGSLTRLGLANLTNLKKLDLDGCGITTIQGLAKLKNLEALDLSDNYYIHGSLEGLANLTNLQVLDLSDNEKLTTLGLSNLTNLEILDLSGNSMTASITRLGICELKNLAELDLSENNLYGHLSPSLSNLIHIKVLDLSSNQLTGNLQSVIANITSLEYLSLDDNKFEGSFSFNSLKNHSKLQVFKLSNSLVKMETEEFPGLPEYQPKALNLRNCSLHALPSFLLHQLDLRFIDLSHNKLQGTFPSWLLQNNTKLDTLYLLNNSLSGDLQLPSSKHDLLRLDISHNKLSGQLPGNMGKILPELLSLNLSENGFEGRIPSSMSEMKRLESLDLSSNNFSGELPRQFLSGCFSLSFLSLSDNHLQGEVVFPNSTNLCWLYLNNNHFSGKIQDGLSKVTSLLELDLSNNMLYGQIPPWFGNLSGLQFLDISENQLCGSVPSSFNLSSLRRLYMHMNAFNGSIPGALRRSLSLTVLDLRDNEFSGSIPIWINEFSYLGILLLRGNQLKGNIPNQLCHLSLLNILDLSYNKFNGPIPACFANVTLWTLGQAAGSFVLWETTQSISTEFEAYYNSTLELSEVKHFYKASGQRGIEFMTKKRYESYKGDILNYMTGLDFSCNELTGDIPSEIGSLSEIRALNLSHNFLSGSIPQSLSNLKMIESLDLSHNDLSGQIPPQLTELNFLSNFNVSYNHLSGPTPNAGQFANFDEQNYGGNSGLCGPRINKSCTTVLEPPETPSDGAEEDESAVDMVAFYWSFVTSSVTVILGLFAILWVNSYWRRLWFYFIDAYIDLCYYWFYKYVLNR